MTFISNVWHGRTYNLAMHYFLFLTIPLMLLGLFKLGIDSNNLSLGRFYDLVYNGFWALDIAVAVFGYVALINCARHYKWTGWSFIAVGVATLSLLGGAGTLVAPADDSEMAEGMATLNAQLPKKLDALTTLTKVSYDNNERVMTYFYEVNVRGNQRARSSAEVKENFAISMCDSFKTVFAGVKEFRLVYAGYGRPDDVIEVTREDCKAF
jgi:hypothetical protein